MTTDLSSIRITIQIQQEGRTTLSILYDFTASDLWTATSQWELRSRISRAIEQCADWFQASLSAGPPAPPKSSKT